MKNSLTIAQRKARLIEEGVAYRAGIGNATQEVRASLRADSLAKNAIAYLTVAGVSLLKGRAGLAGFGLQTALPLLLSGVSALARKPILKSLARGALIAGVVGTVVSIVARKKKPADAS